MGQDCQHRRPYELLLLLQRADHPRKLPDSFTMIAVPGEHSRKPFLGPLLSKHLPFNPKCLEAGPGLKTAYQLMQQL